MFQTWASRITDSVNQRVQVAMRDLVLSFAIVLLAALSFLWGTIAAYLYLVQELGSVKAAGLVAGFYAVLALVLMVIKAASARPTTVPPPRRMDAAGNGADLTSTNNDSVAAFLKAVTSTTGDQEPQVLDAATEALRTLSPIERLGMLAVMGFLAGRKIKR